MELGEQGRLFEVKRGASAKVQRWRSTLCFQKWKAEDVIVMQNKRKHRKETWNLTETSCRPHVNFRF